MRRACIVIVSVTLFVIGCAANQPPCVEPVLRLQAVPQLGEHLSHLEKSCVQTMVAPAQTWPSYEVIADGTVFTVGVDHDGVVRFVATNDKRFRSPEGLHAGDPASAAFAVAPRESILLERGWGSCISLPSGWCAFLDDSRMDSSGHLDLNLGTRPLRPDAKIAMFFMRR